MISIIKINHGETTCASEPGKFCRFLGSKKFGLIPVCLLFGETLDVHHQQHDKAGWVARCGQCHEEFTVNE